MSSLCEFDDRLNYIRDGLHNGNIMVKYDSSDRIDDGAYIDLSLTNKVTDLTEGDLKL